MSDAAHTHNNTVKFERNKRYHYYYDLCIVVVIGHIIEGKLNVRKNGLASETVV